MHRSPRPRRSRSIVLLAIAASCALAIGCSGSADDDATANFTVVSSNAGAAPTTSSPPAALTSVDASLAVVPGWETIAEPIVTRIADLGRVSFELDLDWMEANAGEDVEQHLVTAVASGELDAALVGVRAFSSLDVPGFDVLVAPRLVDSYALQEAVLSGDLPERLLPSLDTVGVVGMAIVPGPMRYPIGVDRAFVSPDDFAGATFHTFAAALNSTTAAALGATHSQLWGDERNDAMDDGTIDVTENSLQWMRDNGRGSFVTLDPLWPAMGVFIVNPAFHAELPSDHLAAIAEAIGSASPRAVDLLAADTDVASALCTAGKHLVASSPDDLAAMLDALRPVYDTLEADEVAGPLLAEIRALDEVVSPDEPSLPSECGGPTDAVTAAGADDPAVLNGTYQLSWTVAELMAFPGVDEGTARGNAGPFTLLLRDGTFDMVWEAFPGEPCGGTYGVSGDRVQFVASTDLASWTCGGESLGLVIMDAAWRFEDDQLVFSDFELSDEPDITWWNSGFFSKPLTRAE